MAAVAACSDGHDPSLGVLGRRLSTSLPCGTVAFTSIAPASAQPSGTAIALAASATCQTGDSPEYAFYWGANNAWHVIASWSASATTTWDSTGVPAGTYTLAVDARHAGGSAAEAEDDASYTLSPGNGPCTQVTIGESPSSPQSIGTTVTVTGSGNCGSPEYRFYVQDTTGTWRLAQDWSSSATFAWDTSYLVSGTYGLAVDAREAGATTYQSEAIASYSLTGGSGTSVKCTSVSVSTSPSGTTTVGTAVTIGGQGNCTNPQYRFYEQDTTGTWHPLQDWSSTATYSWDTSYLPAGTYNLAVDARQSDTTDSPTETIVSYSLTGGNGGTSLTCSTVSLAAKPASPAPAGVSVTWTGTGNCTNPQYQFWVQNLSGKWAVVQDWSSSASYAWNTSGLMPGTYAREVDARQNGATTYQSYVDASFVVLGPCTGVAVAASPASPQPVGTGVTFTASPTCPTGAVPEYQFSLTSSCGTSVVRDWSTGASWAWATGSAAAGTYTVTVAVREQGLTASQATGSTGYTLGTAAHAWSQVATLSGTCNALWAASADEVFCVGNNGYIARSTNDGASWTSETSGTTQNLTSVWGSSDTDVYASGGPLLHSSDGTSWTAIALSGDVSGGPVSGSGATNVYAGGLWGNGGAATVPLAWWSGTAGGGGTWQPSSFLESGLGVLWTMQDMASLAVNAGDAFAVTNASRGNSTLFRTTTANGWNYNMMYGMPSTAGMTWAVWSPGTGLVYAQATDQVVAMQYGSIPVLATPTSADQPAGFYQYASIWGPSATEYFVGDTLVASWGTKSNPGTLSSGAVHHCTATDCPTESLPLPAGVSQFQVWALTGAGGITYASASQTPVAGGPATWALYRRN